MKNVHLYTLQKSVNISLNVEMEKNVYFCILTMNAILDMTVLVKIVLTSIQKEKVLESWDSAKIIKWVIFN